MLPTALLLSSPVVSLTCAFRTLLSKDETAKNAESFAKKRKAFAILCDFFVFFAVEKNDKNYHRTRVRRKKS